MKFNVGKKRGKGVEKTPKIEFLIKIIKYYFSIMSLWDFPGNVGQLASYVAGGMVVLADGVSCAASGMVGLADGVSYLSRAGWSFLAGEAGEAAAAVQKTLDAAQEHGDRPAMQGVIFNPVFDEDYRPPEDSEARELAARELAARELAARELAARELAARELAARELAVRVIQRAWRTYKARRGSSDRR